MNRPLYIFIFSILLNFNLQSQIGKQRNDVSTPQYTKYALINARIYVDAETYIERGTLLVENGKIKAIGAQVVIPQDATIINIQGKYIMPSFIELYSDCGIGKPANKNGEGNQFNSNKSGAFSWNEAIKPENNAAALFKSNPTLADDYLKAGFGLVLSHLNDGIMRGAGSMFLLQQEGDQTIYHQQAATFYSFDKGTSTQDYPSSLMGSIALLRQTLYDASWYKQTTKKQPDLSLESYIKNEKLPMIFQLSEKYDLERAYKIAKEAGIQYIYKTAGDEYQILSQIKAFNPKLIVPINFSKPIKILNEEDWRYVPYQDMLHYQQGPSNLSQLYNNKLNFCITSAGCNLQSEFIKNINKAIAAGLPSRAALRALTGNSAAFVGLDKNTGSLAVGKDAFFIVTGDSLGGEHFEVLENWSLNQRKIFYSSELSDIRGSYTFSYKNKIDTLHISGSLSSAEAVYKQEKAKIKTALDLITIAFNQFHIQFNSPYQYRDTLLIELIEKDTLDQITGRKYTTMIRLAPGPTKATKKTSTTVSIALYPYTDFGNTALLHAKEILFKGATVWTAENDGILNETDVWIGENGKIKSIGKNLVCNTCEVVDAKGLHLSPGIIDEHSHIAITKGVNEGTQSVTSEVRIGDVLDPEDINIYRQLGGGVTSSHLLHGSANCIGGQTQLIKLRWGKSADELKVAGWEGFIKFALGENVKQSNWGDRATVRYPQTRMGVQQVMIDAFLRAKEYQKQWEAYNTGQSKFLPKRDLELDALVEILNDKRHITCHSYVQSEINMLLHVADSMGFKVNTFTHILEGYKVADKMKKHGAAGSTFADWWAYKYEVMEAIPYNAFLMSKMGVLTSVNSDDAEMARRLNQEAAKSMKYGGMSDTEAIKLCTINPAKMLHVEKSTGSIKIAKDADLVLWSHNPTSIQARVLRTYVDGICYYNIDEIPLKKAAMEANRKAIKAQMIEAISKGEAAEQAENKIKTEYNCREDE